VGRCRDGQAHSMITHNDLLRMWKGPSGFVAPFRTQTRDFGMGYGNNNGKVYDGRGVAIVDCLGNEAAADVVAAALNLVFSV
jgi:hypothetical protein